MKKAIRRSVLFMALMLAVLGQGQKAGYAQENDQLQLRLKRNIGFNSGSGQIQGDFTLTATGPQDLQRVQFYLDGQPMGEATQAPFQLRFNTDSFPRGMHTLVATGFTAAGAELRSNEIRAEFVSPGEGMRYAFRIILPILGFVVIAMLLASLLPMLVGRGRTASLPAGVPRNYGFHGGAICPKCGRPFGMHIYGLNLLVGKFDRCPYCGRWSLVHRASPDMLSAAEAAELERAGEPSATPALSEEEQLRRDLADSKYRNL